MLIDQLLFPRSKSVHDSHLLLSLGRETSDLLALNNGFTSSGVEKASKDGWAMATVALLDTFARMIEWAGKEDSHSGDDATVLPDFGRDLLEIRSMGVVNQSSMPCRCKKDTVLQPYISLYPT